MGLMRALSLKRASGILPTRTLSTRTKGRPQISLPTELISTTNILSYTAPSVVSMQQAVAENIATSSTASITTHEEAASEGGYSTQETPSTPITATESRRSSHLSTGSEPSLTDASSVSSHSSANSPHFTESPSVNTSYFTMDTLTKPSSNNSTRILADDSIDPLYNPAPVLPRRAPSHSKREHERLARRRSQRASLGPVSAVESLLASTVSAEGGELPWPTPSSIMPELAEVDEEAPEVEEPVLQMQSLQQAFESVQEQEAKHETLRQELEQSPFCHELEQLNQVVEKLSLLVEDEDVRIMKERNLRKWSVTGYLDVVADVWGSDYDICEEVSVSA